MFSLIFYYAITKARSKLIFYYYENLKKALLVDDHDKLLSAPQSSERLVHLELHGPLLVARTATSTLGGQQATASRSRDARHAVP